MKPLVVIHGWSDESQSFIPLAGAIKDKKKNQRQVEQIWLGDYVSLDDDVRMKDLAIGLQRAWKDRKLPGDPRSTDVIVHSTGGLVIRDWMYRYYTSAGLRPPVRNLVMLAPANFGSPLAHKGRAFYGRVLKGFKSKKRFETGTHILKALEMASTYSWDLAQKDRFGRNVFQPAGVCATVIVGNTGYGGISSLANEDGSDGTVYVSSANMNCAYLKIDFPSLPREPHAYPLKQSKGTTAFLVVDNHNHSSVALKDPEHAGNKDVLANIEKAINISNAQEFNAWVKTCAARTKSVMDAYANKRDEYKQGFQNTVFRVRDDQGFDVKDYVVEFYQDAEKSVFDRVAELFNKKAVSNVHAYKDNPAFRSFMINCTQLYKVVNKEGECLRISFSAMPDINDDKTVVGYRTFEEDDIDYLELGPQKLKEYFIPNRTLFIDIILTREQKKELFTLNKLNDVQ